MEDYPVRPADGHLLARPARNQRAQPGLPFAIRSRRRRRRSTRQRNRHRLPWIRPTPHRNGARPLHDHVIAKNGRQPNRGIQRSQTPSDNERNLPDTGRSPKDLEI